MTVVIYGQEADGAVSGEISERSGQDPSLCMQCGKCTGGCPMTFLYDYSVNQIMNLLNEGRVDEALGSKSIWLCSACHTCSSRCPAGIDVFKVMETLRHMARERGLVAKKSVKVFEDAFLDSVAKHGRVHEAEMMLRYNLLSGKPFTDADLAPAILKKGKLHLRAPKVRGGEEVARIVEKFRRGRES